ncbi:MAG TPA: Gfo/Idh/MocA family oxidoreductase [Vicinamibacteria bacterium]
MRAVTCLLASLGLLALLSPPSEGADEKPLRLAIAGLVHGHVGGFLRAASNRPGVAIVGIADPDPTLHRKYAQRHGLPEAVFFADVDTMLDRVKPEAVASFTSTYDHPRVVEACARRRIPVMMEKPLAVSVEHARAIQRAAESGGIQVIVNYETTWYRSHAALWSFVKEERAAGEIRKLVAMDGHQGPKEIGVQEEFFGWLTDPVQNGAGALYDFGCYGANLMTWLMDGQRPLAVTAMTQRIKPHIYPRVDDEATILVEYPKAQGIVQASWNWPFGRKDLDVYGESGYARAVGGSVLRVRRPGQAEEEAVTPAELPADERDSLSYLTAIVRGRKPSGLSSLDNNLVVTDILEAARESARTGKTVRLSR